MKRINYAFFMESETAVKYVNTQTNVLRYSLEGAEMEIKGEIIQDMPFSTESYKDDNCTLKLLCQANLSIIIEKEIKTFYDKNRIKESMTT